MFGEVERRRCCRLPRERFPFFHEAQRNVSRDGHVEVAKAYYSVPPEYLGHTVWVRWDARLVRIFNHRLEQIAMHVRHEPGRFSTHGRAPASARRSAAWNGRGVSAEQGRAGSVRRPTLGSGDAARRAASKGLRVLQGLLSLGQTAFVTKPWKKPVKRPFLTARFACGRCASCSSTARAEQKPLPFLDEHPIIRPAGRLCPDRRAGDPSPSSRSSMSEGFTRHDWTDEALRACNENSPAAYCATQGRDGLPPPRSGYPSSGCSSAEPDSVSPDNSSVVPLFSPSYQENRHE